MKIKSLIKLSILPLILFTFQQCEKEKSTILYDKDYVDEIKEVRKNIQFFIGTNYIPGASFAISKQGKIIYSEGAGLASRDLNVKVTRDTKFRIGDVSSLYTNMIFHQLQKEGLLHEDSTIKHYYPELPEKYYQLKLHHLVQQTSGIRNPTIKETTWSAFNVSLQKGIEIFQNDSLIAPPGWYQEQNMFNYNLLGAIMEKVTNKSFSVLVEEYISDTLNLENTVVDNPFIAIEGRTDFFDTNFISHVINATSRDLRFKAPSEGILSNAEDMVKFGNAVLYSDYLNEVIDESFFEPIRLEYNNMPSFMANEWILIKDRQNRKVYGKAGSVTGGSAAILIFPEEELVLAGVVNLNDVEENIPIFEMASHFLENETDESEDNGQTGSANE